MQSLGDLIGLGKELAGDRGKPSGTAPNAPGVIPVTTVPSPDGNTVYQASGTALGHAATLSVAKNGDVSVAVDRDNNGTKETIVSSKSGATPADPRVLTVQNTENTRGVIAVNDKPLADALAAGGFEAIPTSNPKKIPKNISQTDLDREVAEALVAAGEVPPPAQTPPPAATGPKPKGRTKT